jgi:quercetin dioxygenase-like cupin family protein
VAAEASTRAVHLSRADEGETVVVVGDAYRLIVTGAETGGAYMVMEARVPVGHGPPLHVHDREDEGFQILEGEVDFEAEGRTVRLGPGDFVNLPKGVTHRFQNNGGAAARMLITCAPAGIEGFFRAAHQIDSPATLTEIAARFGITILPPA